jgi:hypothetical protein
MSKTKKYNGKNNFKTKTQKGGIRVGPAKAAYKKLKTEVYGSTLKGVATELHKFNREKNRYNQSKATLASTPSPTKQKFLSMIGRSAAQQKQKAENALFTMYNRTRNSTTTTPTTKPTINAQFFTNLQKKKNEMETAYDNQKREAYQAASTPAALQKRTTNSENLISKQEALAQLYRQRNTLSKNTGKTNRATQKKAIETLQSTLKSHNLYSGPQSVASLTKEANKGVFSFIQNKVQGKKRIYKTLTPEKVSTLLNTKQAAEEKTIASQSQGSSNSSKVLTLIPTVTASTTPSTTPSTKTSPAINNGKLLEKLSQLSAQVLTKDFAVKAAKAQAAYITQKGALTGIIDSEKISAIETTSPTQSYAKTKEQIQQLGLKKKQENVLLEKFKIDKQQQLATIRTPSPTAEE